MTNSGRISVVVPVYETEDLLARALKSLSYSTRLPDEVIIVVASKKNRIGSLELWERVAEHGLSAGLKQGSRIPRVRCVFSPGATTAEARNIGVDCAFGEIIAFLDSDDEYLPLKLAMSEMALFEREGIVCSGMVYVDERGDTPKETEVWHPPVSLSSMAKGLCPISNQVVSRSVLERVPFDPDFRVCEDYAWCANCAMSGERFIVLPMPLHRYHKRKLSKTVCDCSCKEEESKEIQKTVRMHLKSTGGPIVSDHILSSCALELKQARSMGDRTRILERWITEGHFYVS